MCTITALAFHKFDDLIIRCSLVGNQLPTGNAPMKNHPATLSILVKSDGLHKTLADRRTVPGAQCIHVFGVETQRTVVAAGAMFNRFHGTAAVFADERFLAGKKSHRNNEVVTH